MKMHNPPAGSVSAVLSYLAPYRRALLGLALLQLVQSLAALFLPRLSADLIDFGVIPGDPGQVLRLGAVMLGVSLAQILFSIGATYLAVRLSIGYGRDLRRGVFAHVQGLSLQDVGHFGSSSLITRTTNDVQQLQTGLLMALTMIVSAPIMAVGGVIMAVRQNAGLSSLLAVSVPALAIVVGLLMSRTIPYFRQMQAQIDRLNQILREQITGLRVIRAFVRDGEERQRFAAANEILTETALHTGRLMASMIPMATLVMQWSSVALVWFAARHIGAGTMEVGSLVAFLTYVAQILISVMIAAMLFAIVPRALVCARRIDEVLATPAAVRDPAQPRALPTRSAEHRQRSGVEFRNVGFCYPGAAAPTLSEISLRIEPGQTVAIIGATGCGKSTLLNLIPRLFDVTSGSVLVDGIDVRELSRMDLWGAIGLVPQQAFLFSGTIASNLRFGQAEASDTLLWAALEVAQASAFVSALAQGLQTPVAQGGGNFSGGQRQRLTIARALLVKPRIYLFDDSFSALDFATDARLRAALRPATADAATLIVGQRVSSLRHADTIVLLEHGTVVGVGTHAALLAQCPTYRAIVDSQDERGEPL